MEVEDQLPSVSASENAVAAAAAAAEQQQQAAAPEVETDPAGVDTTGDEQTALDGASRTEGETNTPLESEAKSAAAADAADDRDAFVASESQRFAKGQLREKGASLVSAAAVEEKEISSATALFKQTKAATAAHQQLSSRTGAPLNETKSNEGIWKQVLTERREKNPPTPAGHILLLGCEDVGKTTLLCQLQRLGFAGTPSEIELHHDAGGVSDINYAFIGARRLFEEEEAAAADVQAKVHVWILQNGDAWESVARRFNACCLSHTLILICLDGSEAWSALSLLTSWLRVADKVLLPKIELLPAEKQEELKENTLKYLATYRRHTLHTLPTRAPTEGRSAFQDDPASYPSLASSIGVSAYIPICVCLTRSDTTASCLASRESPRLLDIFLAYLRNACMHFGAALVFTSCKDSNNPKNVFLLYRYIMHRIYKYSFREPAQLEDLETLFVPSGWDTEEELQKAVAATAAETFDQPYEAFVARSSSGAKPREPSAAARVVAQPMSAFLTELQQKHSSAVISYKQQQQQQKPSIARRQTKEVRLSLSGENSFDPKKQVAVRPDAGGEGEGDEQKATTTTAAATATAGSPAAAEGRLRLSQLGAAASSSSKNLETDTADNESLQTFFQGLMARTRGKTPTTPRERAKAAFRPKAPTSPSSP